jgi:hypothetical protein
MRKNPRQIVRICTTLKEPMFPLSVKWIINESIVEDKGVKSNCFAADLNLFKLDD